METSTLRWILIVAGLVIIALIFLFGKPDRKKPRASRRNPGARSSRGWQEDPIRREPTIGSRKEDETSAGEPAGAPGDQGELPIDSGNEIRVEKRDLPAPDKIVSLFLLARDNHMITGAQLLEATVKTGMDFGEMNIFHRLTDGDDRPVFSLANASKPGYFDRDSWHEFETGALVLFATMPNPMSALDAWDAMLATARRVAAIVDAELQDEDHHPFSRQKEAQIREEMRDYDRSRIPARR